MSEQTDAQDKLTVTGISREELESALSAAGITGFGIEPVLSSPIEEPAIIDTYESPEKESIHLGYVGFYELEEFAKKIDLNPKQPHGGLHFNSLQWLANGAWGDLRGVAKIHFFESDGGRPWSGYRVSQTFSASPNVLKRSGVELYESPRGSVGFAYSTRDEKWLQMFRATKPELLLEDRHLHANEDGLELNLDALSEAMKDPDYFREYMLSPKLNGIGVTKEELGLAGKRVDKEIQLLRMFIKYKSREPERAEAA